MIKVLVKAVIQAIVCVIMISGLRHIIPNKG